MTEKDGKSCFVSKKMISTSKRHAEHPFAGQNTQQEPYSQSNLWNILKILPNFETIIKCLYRA